MKLIIKKEKSPEWISLKMIKTYKFKWVAKLMKKYYKKKGYEVEWLS